MIYLKLFLTFLRIGALTFGGGYAMLPLVSEAVVANGWMDLSQVTDFIAISESTPGPFAINMATYTGLTVCGGFGWSGLFGAFCATLGVVLPSFIVILIVARFYEAFKKSVIVSGVMSGLRPCVLGMISATIISVGLNVFFPAGLAWSVFGTLAFWASLGIFIISLVLILNKISPILTIVVSAGLGIACGYMGFFG